MVRFSTLCYIEQEGSYLMLHRTKKKQDVNQDKWIGVGGHFEPMESPEECVMREVWEETGYRLLSYRYRGMITFVYGSNVTEYISLFTADEVEGELHCCEEGILQWIDKKDVFNLNIWEGDHIFLHLLEEREDFFSLKLVYDKEDVLRYAALDGNEIQL